MKMNKLFNEDKTEKLNKKGNEVSEEVYKALEPIFKKYFKDDFLARDIRAIVIDSSCDIMLNCILGLYNKN